MRKSFSYVDRAKTFFFLFCLFFAIIESLKSMNAVRKGDIRTLVLIANIMEYYRCGQILTTHGLKGELKVRSFSDFNRFEQGKRLYILHQGQYIEVKIQEAKAFGKNLLVRFENLLDINLVQKFHGDMIYVSAVDRQDDLAEDEVYHTDLIGKEVINQEGASRGVVQEVRSFPASDYLLVKYKGNNVYIPFIKEFIVAVGDTITINEIEGLFKNED